MQHSQPCPLRPWMLNSWQASRNFLTPGYLAITVARLNVKLASQLPWKTVLPHGFARGQILHILEAMIAAHRGGLRPWIYIHWLQTVSFDHHIQLNLLNLVTTRCNSSSSHRTTECYLQKRQQGGCSICPHFRWHRVQHCCTKRTIWCCWRELWHDIVYMWH